MSPLSPPDCPFEAQTAASSQWASLDRRAVLRAGEVRLDALRRARGDNRGFAAVEKMMDELRAAHLECHENGDIFVIIPSLDDSRREYPIEIDGLVVKLVGEQPFLGKSVARDGVPLGQVRGA